MTKLLESFIAILLLSVLASGQGMTIAPKTTVFAGSPGTGGTLTLVQQHNCAIGNGAATCTFTVSPNLASGNLDIFSCFSPTNAPISITGITNAGGTLVQSYGAGIGGFQTGGTGDSTAAAWILPSTSTGGSGNPVVTVSANSTSLDGYCYMAEYHPSANPNNVGLDIDMGYATPSASTTLTNSTAVTPTSTNYVALQGAMALDTFGVFSAVASPYNTNAYLPGSGWVAFSTATPVNGNWASWTVGSSSHGFLQSLYFGYNPTACQPNTVMDFENSTTGTAVTNALLAAGIKGWQGGSWSSTINLIQYNSAASMPLTNNTGRLCDGNSVTGGAGSLGLQVTGTGSAAIDSLSYQWGSGNPNTMLIAQMNFNENLLASSNSDQDCLSVHGASDFASCNAYGTGATRFFGLETILGNGGAINAPGGTWVGTCPCPLRILYNSGSGGVTATSVTAAVSAGTVTFTGTFTASQWPVNFAFSPSGCTSGTNYNSNVFLVQTSSASTITASATVFPNGGTAPVSSLTVSGSPTTCTLTGQHLLQVYNSSGVQIGASFHAGITTASTAQYVVFGTPNNQAIPSGKVMQFDSLQISFNGVIPSL